MSAPSATLGASASREFATLGAPLAVAAAETGVKQELVVGAPGGDDNNGAVYVFQAASTTKWVEGEHAPTQVAELEGTEGYSELGESVAISGETIAAGAPGYEPGKHDFTLGAVFVFEEPAKGWETTDEYGARLHGGTPSGPQGEACPQLGASVAVAEHAGTITVAAGAPGVYDTDERVECKQQIAGEVEVFTGNAASWSGEKQFEATQRLLASPSEVENEFGQSVAISSDGSIVAAGAPDESKEEGAAYVFTDASGWGAPATITSPSVREGSLFGYGLALSPSGAKLVVAKPGYLSHGEGGVLVYEQPAGGVWASTSTPAEELVGSEAEYV